MKQKEIVQLMVAIVILALAGLVLFSIFGPKSSNPEALTYTKVTKLDTEFDQTTMNHLSDSSKSRDFYVDPDLKSGLNNSQPFGPLK
ncbi:MAG TPA: hypothetical protein VLF21_00025 [Candidatus Saccharimonadales bacterium]|nr:hypothetical protein [Candidatus Saccharimonadales bacterium]